MIINQYLNLRGFFFIKVLFKNFNFVKREFPQKHRKMSQNYTRKNNFQKSPNSLGKNKDIILSSE